jgi:predicted nucleic acid-binding protein
MVCLDASFLIAHIRGDKAAFAKLIAIEEEGSELTTTPVSFQAFKSA